MANILELLSKDGNTTPEKARKSRQMQFWGPKWLNGRSRVTCHITATFDGSSDICKALKVIFGFQWSQGHVQGSKGFEGVSRYLQLCGLYFIYLK